MVSHVIACYAHESLRHIDKIMEANWEVMSISANGTKESVNDENGARMPPGQGDQAGDFSPKMRRKVRLIRAAIGDFSLAMACNQWRCVVPRMISKLPCASFIL
jgi:hypothetical protein